MSLLCDDLICSMSLSRMSALVGLYLFDIIFIRYYYELFKKFCLVIYFVSNGAQSDAVDVLWLARSRHSWYQIYLSNLLFMCNRLTSYCIASRGGFLQLCALADSANTTYLFLCKD